MPDADRWRVGQEWTRRRLGQRPTADDLARDKKLLKARCEFAARVVDNGWLVVNGGVFSVLHALTDAW